MVLAPIVIRHSDWLRHSRFAIPASSFGFHDPDFSARLRFGSERHAKPLPAVVGGGGGFRVDRSERFAHGGGGGEAVGAGVVVIERFQADDVDV